MTLFTKQNETILICESCGFQKNYLTIDGYPSTCPQCGAAQSPDEDSINLEKSLKAAKIKSLQSQLADLQKE